MDVVTVGGASSGPPDVVSPSTSSWSPDPTPRPRTPIPDLLMEAAALSNNNTTTSLNQNPDVYVVYNINFPFEISNMILDCHWIITV